MKSMELMRKYIELLRYDTGSPLPFILGLVTSGLVLTNLFTVFLKEPDNLEKCFLAMKDILIILSMFSSVVKRLIDPEGSIQLSRLIEEEYFIDRCQLDIRRIKGKKIRKLYDEKRKDLESASQTITGVIGLGFFVFVFRYLFLDLFVASSEGGQRGLSTPLVAYNPPNFDQIAFPTYIFALHGFLMLMLCLEGFSIYASLWLCVKKIITDFETIYILLDEIANDYPDFAVKDNLKSMRSSQQGMEVDGGYIQEDVAIDVQYNNENIDCCYDITALTVKQTNQKSTFRGKNNDAAKEEDLQKDMKIIVQFHLSLNRNQDNCARVTGYGILVLSFIVAVDTCYNIFKVLQADNSKMFMNYAVACVFINVPLLLNYYIGQQISNQNEIFRRCLTELPWINKPHWFKQSMLIMMARANVDIEFKPFGVFVLNLTSYTDMMKAAFSYGNLIYRRNQINQK